MKTDLSHLPPEDQQALRRIAERIREAVPAEMIILFGSYARGDWVVDRYDEDGVTYEYVSDYDILVIVPPPKDLGYDGPVRFDQKIELDVDEALGASRVTAIAHNISYLNTKLQEGHYFFSDIVKEGVLLYDSGNYELAGPRELSNAERKRLAEEDFEEWFESAQEFYETFEFAVSRQRWKHAAFQLHQATERFYAAFLLVHTGYKPKTHDLKKLDGLAAAQVPDVIRVFPRVTAEEKVRFERLRKAYVGARYKKGYKISREDLEYLGARVRELRAVTQAACRRKIEGLGP